MQSIKIVSAVFILVLASICSFGQRTTKKVLFMGNSYTAGLPNLISELASSMGDSLIFHDGSGGQSIKDHATSQHSLASISQSKWDYVVVQCQSQEAAFTPNYLRTNVFPFAKILADSIHASNPCTKTIFYMTWGRKNGDAANCANWPPMCTFEGMQLELRKNYLKMGFDNNAFICPVGMSWRHARKNFPRIELYDSDESHPSMEGMHLSASTFYAVIFGKSPVGASQKGSVSRSDQDSLNKAADFIVFDSLATWNISYVSGTSKVSYTASNDTVQFINHNTTLDSALWDFGDGQNVWQISPMHIYDSSGTYRVTTISFNSCKQFDTSFVINVTVPIDSTKDTTSQDTTIKTGIHTILHDNRFEVYPNPSLGRIVIRVNADHQEIRKAEFVLYGLDGKQLFKQTLSAAENELVLPVNSAGIYFYSIDSGPKHKLVILE